VHSILKSAIKEKAEWAKLLDHPSESVREKAAKYVKQYDQIIDSFKQS
jgi:hypothetical protein